MNKEIARSHSPMKYCKLIVVLIILLVYTVPVFATETQSPSPSPTPGPGIDQEILTQQIDSLDFSDIEEAIDQSENVNEDISFKEIFEKTITGQLDLSLSGIFSSLGHILFAEIYECSGLLRNILIISVFSALLKNLTESFENKAVGELGFYVCYIVLITVLFDAFITIVGIAEGVIGSVAALMAASVPLIITLLLMSGSIASSIMFSPLFIFITNMITAFVSTFLAPFIVLAAGMKIINFITEKEILTNFSELLKSICSWSIKFIAFVFLTTLALQKLSVPILNNLATKTAKSTVKVIPVVGDVLNGAMDMVIYWADAAKSGVLVALIIIIILICVFPIMKLVAFIFIFKFIAAIIQPVCDEKIVECVDAIGDFSFLLLECCVTVIVMFVLSVVIMLSFG